MTTISVAPAAFAPRTAALISSVFSSRPSWYERESPPVTCSHLTMPATPSMSLTMNTFTEPRSLSKMETGLAGKGVVVTGASGGIGAACARAFAAEGARVAVHYHRGRERAETLAAELGDAATVGGDLTDERDVDNVFTRARET